MHNIAVPCLHICNIHTCPVHSCTTSCKIHTYTTSCNIHTCTIPIHFNFPHIYIYICIIVSACIVRDWKTPPERTNLIGVRIVNVLCWPPVLHLKEHFWKYTPMAMLFDVAAASQLSDDETLPKFFTAPPCSTQIAFQRWGFHHRNRSASTDFVDFSDCQGLEIFIIPMVNPTKT